VLSTHPGAQSRLVSAAGHRPRHLFTVVPPHDSAVIREDDDIPSRLGYRHLVKTLLPLLRSYVFDVLVVAAAVGSVIEFIVRSGDAEFLPTTTNWFLIPAALVTILPLLARRRLPFLAPATVLILAAAVSFVEGNFAPFSFAIFVSIIAAAFLLGMNADRREALAAVPLIVATVVIATRNQPSGSTEDGVFITIILLCAWVGGFALSRRLAEARRAEERAVVLAAEQAKLAEEAVEEERSRIARELHDVVAHHVSVMTVQAGAVRRLLRPEQEREREALVSVEETGRKALTEMRRLLGVLKEDAAPAPLAPQPGMATLDTLLDQVREAGLPVELTTEGDPVELAPGVDLSAYRIIQEALTNALKHAGPARAWVVVRYGEKNLELEIANDGRSDGNSAVSGHGLVGMKERVAVYGGQLESGPRPGGGFAVRARLPIEAEAA
jgi:signal transduction histidine kinase